MDKELKNEIYGKNKYRFHELQIRFGLVFISEKNNMLQFSIGNKEYYLGLIKFKIREKGKSEWSGEVIKILKQDYENMLSNIIE
jgi:hypothetical protein